MFVVVVGGYVLTTFVFFTIEGMGCVADKTPGIDVLVSSVPSACLRCNCSTSNTPLLERF